VSTTLPRGSWYRAKHDEETRDYALTDRTNRRAASVISQCFTADAVNPRSPARLPTIHDVCKVPAL